MTEESGLLSHLADLRTCLLRCLTAVIVLIFALLPFSGTIYAELASPLLDSLPVEGNLISTSVLGPFTVQLSTAVLSAFLVALPYLWFEVWRFIAPGLYEREKRLALPVVASATLLFYLGMIFAYFMVFRVVFGFISSIAPAELVWMPDAHSFFSFAITIFVAFGVAFETPVIVWLLTHAGIVEADTLRRGRRYVIVGAFVVAAIFTPPDVISQLLLAIPCWLLFELGLFFAPKNSRAENSSGELQKSDK